MLKHSGQPPGLPAPRTALIGREGDLAIVRDILSEPENRLLTLSGIGGCGKTRLALQLVSDLAADYPERNWTIELAAITDPELIPTVVAEALGLPESSLTSSIAELVNYLQVRPALLLLDNCEHLVDACAVFVDTLLASCPDLLVVATSREPLHIPGERQYRVPPLDVPEPQDMGDVNAIKGSPAVQLFVTRAQATLPSFELTPSNADGVARICVRLEGIPLALELAAPRVHVLGLEQLLARLEQSFHVLSGSSRVAPTRHQTLRATLEWSDDLLTEDERTVFRRLAVFAGEFRIGAVEAICSDRELEQEATLDIMSSLADKSLVVTESDEQVAWYRLLEPVREYAWELLDARGETAIFRTRHAVFYLDLAERAADDLLGPGQQRWMPLLNLARPNLRAALDWTRQVDPILELRLAVALAPYWHIYGQPREGLRQLRDALERNEELDDLRLRMRALAALGRLGLHLEQAPDQMSAEADRFSRESLRLARELGDDRVAASTLRDLGTIYRMQRDYARAISCLEESRAIFQALEDEPGAMRVLMDTGLTLYRSAQTPDDRARAARMLEESLESFRTFNDLRFAGLAQVLLGRVAHDRGDLAQAIRLITDGMMDHLRLNDQWIVAFDLFGLSEILLSAGQSRQAVRFAGAAQAASDRLSRSLTWTAFANIVTVIDQVNVLRHEDWFDATWAEGYGWNAEEAVTAARTLSELGDGGQTAAPDEPASQPLTPRELEVAHLLADEYSDRQIAAALFIAPSTVASHVHHILQKLNLRSRVQVADWLAMQPENPTDPA